MTHRTLSYHMTTIETVERMADSAGHSKCGLTVSQFQHVKERIADFRDLLTWLQQNEAAFRAWNAQRKKEGTHDNGTGP